MTVTTQSPASATYRPRFADRKLSFIGTVRSEALKFRTLTTNWVMTGVMAVVMLGMAPLYAAMLNSFAEDTETMAQAAEGMEATNAGIESITNMAYAMGGSGIDLANMLIASVAVVFIGAEYATRSIQTSMTVVPRRTSLYLAKLLVLTVYAFVLGTVLSALAYIIGYAVLNSSIQDTMEFSSGLVLNWVAAGLYFMFMAWMGYGFGALFRNNAGGIVLVVFLMLILPIIASIFMVQVEWVADAYNYLPSGLGRVILTYDLTSDAEISYLEGGAWFAVWAAVPALLGYLRFRFTDVGS
ncbi:ABC transporter permease [Rothia nasisuis]|uniref:ABC transporter permease n=1 Tax=Rothia nasisuis TaxID=2109647 RepID=UPI001F398C5B|nr:ABC transporter permease [Rothia nasisuis]